MEGFGISAEGFGISAGAGPRGFPAAAGPRGFSAGPRWVDGPAAARPLRVARPLGSAARPWPRPRPGVRLTRRGRVVLIVLALLLAAVATVLAAPASRAADPVGAPPSVVVRLGG